MKQFYQRCFAVLLLSLLTVAAYAQKPVTGTVTDGTRNPVPGVNVKVKGTATGTVTNGDGKYTITVSEGAVLVFSMIG